MPQVDEEALRRLLTAEPEGLLREGPGRQTFPWRFADGALGIVKRYRGDRSPGGLLDRLPWRSSQTPGIDEFETLRELQAHGVSVPAPIASHRSGSTSLVVMEHLEDLVSLRDHLKSCPGEAARLFPPVLELVTAFHGAGYYHRDLYLDHLVLAGAERRLVLIDLERARKDPRPRRRWFIKDLAALWHSLPAEVSRTWALRFLVRWLDAWGVTGRAARRRWQKAILAKEARMAKHTPRGGTSYPRGR